MPTFRTNSERMKAASQLATPPSPFVLPAAAAELALAQATVALLRQQLADLSSAEGEDPPEASADKGELEERLAAAEYNVMEAERVAMEQTFLFRFVHISDPDKALLRDQLAERVRDLRHAPRFVLQAGELREELGRLPEAELIEIKLALDGLGESASKAASLRTGRDLLTSASDSIREQYLPMVEKFGTPSTAATLLDAVERMAVDAITLDEETLDHGLPVHLTGVEEAIVHNLDEDDPLYREKLLARRREALERHLTMERERLERVREEQASRYAGWGRERLIDDLTAAMLRQRIEPEAGDEYLDQHILKMAQWQDQTDGEWCVPFTDLENLRERCDGIPGLRDFLLEGIGPFCDGRVQKLIASAPFRAALE